MKKIKSFEDACAKLGIDPEQIRQQYPADVLAFKKLTVIAEALNEGWKPDWSDRNQWKYFPWFYNETGSGFSFNGVGGGCCASSSLGSRLCFKTEALAKYAGTQFESLYNEFLS